MKTHVGLDPREVLGILL